MSDLTRDRLANRLLETALDLPTGDRLEWVAARTEGDPELRQLVLRLLDAVAEPTAVGVPAALRPEHEDGVSLVPGERVGSFEIVEEIGRGGMARVFRAERREGGFAQTVAIKVLASGVASGDVVARLGRERQILATLRHSNIASVLDGGSLPNGLPYLVLEYIDGAPLDRFAAAVGLERRLRLMITVARAVQHAHRLLVVHRDLKPSNILVDTSGAVKLLDFGIAKVLEPDEQLAALETAAGLRVLTPQWASPEQVLGEPVTTAVDIYQLGLLLYHLCCDVPAHALRDTSWSELRRVVCEQPPPRPSVVAKAAGRTVSLELEAVILRALEKEPERRYGSAEDFARDLERILLRQPVSVRPSTPLYRAQKLIERHRLASALVIGGSLALVASLGLLAVQTGRLVEQRDRAALESLRAQEAGDFLASLFDLGSPLSGRTVSAKELVDQGIARIDREAFSQAEVRHDLMERLAWAAWELGEPDRGVELARRLLEETGPLGPAALERASMLLLLAESASGRGDLRHAERLFRAAISAADGSGGEVSLVSLNARRGLAKHWERADRLQEAEAMARSVVQSRRANDREGRLLISDLRILGSILIEREEIDEALEVLQEAHDRAVGLFGPGDPRVIKPSNDLAFAIEDAGLFDRAEALRRDSLAAELRLLPEGHPTLALARHNLARVLYRQGELVEAEELARQASSALSASLGPDHTESLVAAFNLGLVLRERGDSAAALEVFSRQLDVLGERLGPAHPRVRTLRSIAGQAALDQGRLAFAESLAEALRADPRGPHEHLFLARVALARGRPGATLALLEQWDQLTEGTLRQRLRIEGRLWEGLAEVELQGRLSSETESSLAAASGSTPRLAQLAESIQRRLGGKSPESP